MIHVIGYCIGMIIFYCLVSGIRGSYRALDFGEWAVIVLWPITLLFFLWFGVVEAYEMYRRSRL